MMDFQPIAKPPEWHVTPNLVDYEVERRDFSWEVARGFLDGLGPERVNIAHEAVGRHAAGSHRHHLALRWLGKKGGQRDFSYAELDRASNRFANVLIGLGVERGDRVFVLTGRIPELYIAALGTLKCGAVLAPLFSAFGPEPIKQRLVLGDGRVLITTDVLYRKKVAGIRHELPALEHVIAVPTRTGMELAGVQDWEALMAPASESFTTVATAADDMALLHFTSGTTGTPKGAVHVHGAVLSHYVSARYALDLHPDDVFWCTADPGWVTGTSYGFIAPLTHGVTMVVDEAEFDAERWYSILEAQQVTVWYTAPTAIRMLMKAGAEMTKDYDLSALRFVASVGEPLNPEGVVWGLEAFGMAIHDNWWQTETGAIMIANYAACEVRPGSMGRPLPGIEAAVLRRDAQGKVLVEDGAAVLARPGEEGELALRPGWPSMFRGYLHMEERYRGCFVGGWYHTGDLAELDQDGYFWFLGRADDVIKSAGHLIGPFEVESVLIEHEAVAEAGVIGKPDPVAGEVVKAFVSLNPGHDPDEALRRDIIAHARTKLGPAVAPRELDFKEALPKTRSGKIMRRLLKAWELDLPTGDLSTLETFDEGEGS